MNVVLSTMGRFHTFDLARQLEARGSLTRVFSGYPMFKLRDAGVRLEKITTFPWLYAPYVYFHPTREGLKRWWSWGARISFDRFVSTRLPECDIFHGLSGFSLKSGVRAQSRGAKYICDRGSSHIRFQNDILLDEYERQGLPFPGIDPRVIEAEEAEYEASEAITVPSRFARDTFLRMGVAADRVHAVPLGVELSRYRPVANPASNEFQVLFAGSISVRKGISYLIDAYEKLTHPAKRLVLAGEIEPELNPLLRKIRNRQDVTFTGHLRQAELVKVMSASHVLVLPSLEDGMGMVQAQAMACGCPVIASENTGALELFCDGVDGFVVPIRDSDAIAARLQRLADDPELQSVLRDRALARVRGMGGWDTYGNLVDQTYREILDPRVRSVGVRAHEEAFAN